VAANIEAGPIRHERSRRRWGLDCHVGRQNWCPDQYGDGSNSNRNVLHESPPKHQNLPYGLPGGLLPPKHSEGKNAWRPRGPLKGHTLKFHSHHRRGSLMRRTLLAAAPILLMIAAPTSSKADAVGAAFGAGTGLVVAGPPGAVVGGVVGAIWGRPFWGPPNSPHACWIDNSFYRHCRYYAGRWHYY
jgi:hypothetical protein